MWKAVLKGAFAIPMTPEELALFRAVAQRDPPKRRVRELNAIVGRRGGNSHAWRRAVTDASPDPGQALAVRGERLVADGGRAAAWRRSRRRRRLGWQLQIIASHVLPRAISGKQLFSQLFVIIGERGGNRTHDPLIKRNRVFQRRQAAPVLVGKRSNVFHSRDFAMRTS